MRETILNRDACKKLVTDKNAQRATEDAELLANLQATARRKGPIADALAVAAKQLHEGASLRSANEGFLDALRGKVATPAKPSAQNPEYGHEAQLRVEAEDVRQNGKSKPAKFIKGKDEKETTISTRNVDKGRARIAAARLERQQRLLQKTVRQSRLNSVARPQSTFYSGLIRAAENIKQEKASPNQWSGMIRNAQGVKPEEIASAGFGWKTD